MRMFKRLEAAQHFGKRPDRCEILCSTYIYPVWPGLLSIKKLLSNSMETCLMVQSKANFMEVTLLFNNGGSDDHNYRHDSHEMTGIDYCIIFSCRWQMRMFKREPEMNQEYQGSPLRSWWLCSYQMFNLEYIIRKCQIYRSFLVTLNIEQHTGNIFVFVQLKIFFRKSHKR